MRDVERRRQRDHERYLRQREARLERQRAYYQEHRDELLRKAKNRYIKL